MSYRQTRAPSRAQAATPTRVQPQPFGASPALQQPTYSTAPNAALLIDFDNVTMGIRSDLAAELKSLLTSSLSKGKIAIQRAYADWRRYPQYVLPLTEASIDLIYAPAYGSAKKNATDIRLAIDAMELVFTRPEIGTIILLSGDSDFSSLVIKLKEYGKYVIGVGIRESSSDLLVQNCDEYYSYNSLAGLVKSGDDPVARWDPWELVREAAVRMTRDGDVMRADRLKQVMQEIDNSFDEKDLNISKFSRFVQEAAERGIITTRKLDNGQLEIALPGESRVVEPAVEVRAERPADRQPSRAEKPRERADAPPARAEAPKAEAKPEAPRQQARPAEQRPTIAPSAAAPEAAAASPQQTGERLTRDAAFDLLRRAVEALAVGSDGKPASDSAVRVKARELLGRDSETLAERFFSRILKDAHDANVIDLKRRGDGYEVLIVPLSVDGAAPASGAAASPGAQGSQPATAPAAPKVVSRAGRAGFGKKLGEIPPELLSIGVVNMGGSKAAAPAQPAASAAATTSAAASTDGAKPPAPSSEAAVEGSKAAGAADKPAPRKRSRRGTRKKAVAKSAAATGAEAPEVKTEAKEEKAPARKATRRGTRSRARKKTTTAADSGSSASGSGAS